MGLFIIRFQEGDGVIIGDQLAAIGLSCMPQRLNITQPSLKQMAIILLKNLGSLPADYWLLAILGRKDIIILKINRIKILAVY